MEKQGIDRFYKYAKVNDLNVFRDDVNMGIDQNIFIGEDLFWLGAWRDNTRIISQCPDGRTEGIYKDADDMLNNFIFGGKRLIDLINAGAVDYADE